MSPQATQNLQEHAKFAQYLKESVLQIQVWDGDAEQTLYGTAQIPLARLLRQGQPTIVVPQILNLYEPTFNAWVG